MGITFHETPNSRRGTTDRRELIYNLRGTSSEATARSTVESSAPATFDGLPRQDPDIELEPIWVDTTTAKGQWLVTVPYAKLSPLGVGDSVLSFETGGGTQHITQSLATIGKYGDGFSPLGCGGAIGVTSDSVEGVDITVPVYQWSETHYLADDDVTQAYRKLIADLTGRTNAGTFRGFAAGEVLFLGATGTKRSDGVWEITFRFAASANRTNITVGNITVTSKKGWEYLWCQYEEDTDANSNRLIKKPYAAYVEKVYEEGDYTDLGI